MLSALFTTLQTSLSSIVSKTFVLSSLLPIMLFLGACFGISAALGPAASHWVYALNPPGAIGTSVPWSVTAWSIGVTALALIWSSLNGFLLELLEGKHLGPFSGLAYAGEIQRLSLLDQQIGDVQANLRKLEKPIPGGGPRAAHYELRTRLLDARRAGVATVPPHPYPSGIRERAFAALKDERGSRPMTRVRWNRYTGRGNTFETLEPAVNALAAELRAGNLGATAMHRDHSELLMAINEAREKLHFETRKLNTLRQFTFPSVPNATRGESGLVTLAPTRLGNLTRTMRSYTLDRYGMDLEVFWTRLQKVAIEKGDKGFAAMQDAKTQVDFLVSLCWLTVSFTVLWSLACVCICTPPFPRGGGRRTHAGPDTVPCDVPELHGLCRPRPECGGFTAVRFARRPARAASAG